LAIKFSEYSHQGDYLDEIYMYVDCSWPWTGLTLPSSLAEKFKFCR